MENSKYKVCIQCQTYNQSDYIIETMNGFCLQHTNFPYVCCIIDDASSDGEDKIIEQYVVENFDLAYQEETTYAKIIFSKHKENKNCYFAILLLKENHYSQRKDKVIYLSRWRNYCEYEALCEGDDYWTNKDKLQMQVDYLDTHKDCALVYSKARCYIQEKQRFSGYFGEKTEDFKTLLYKNGISTLTSMYRISSLIGYRNLINGQKWLMGDRPVWLYISLHNKIHFENRIDGVYRILKYSASKRYSYDSKKSFILSSYEVRSFFARKYANKELPILEEKKKIDLFMLAFKEKKYYDVIMLYKQMKNINIKSHIKYAIAVVLNYKFARLLDKSN